MAESNKNNVANVSSAKGVTGGYIFPAPVGTERPTDFNGDSTETWPAVLELVLKDGRRWRKVVPLAQSSELDDLTLAVGELAARALTVKYLTDEDGNTCYDDIPSTETAEGK